MPRLRNGHMWQAQLTINIEWQYKPLSLPPFCFLMRMRKVFALQGLFKPSHSVIMHHFCFPHLRQKTTDHRTSKCGILVIND